MSSSPAAAFCNKKYDVFLSFRGSDTRQGFLSHLHKALNDQNISVFVDDQLKRGKEISDSLSEKIEESQISIVIFSQHYAYSVWCLEELLKIAKCRNTTGQMVMPVFYGVDPSHIQDLSGTYGDALAQHRTQFDESLVEKWGNVLKDIAFLSGHVSSQFSTESILIEEIIKQALEKLDCLYPSDSASDFGLVGIGCRVKKVMSLFCGSEDVCIVGIWGEGGIGKTTLAQAIFERIRFQFDIQCFVGNVKGKSEFTTDTIPSEVVSKLFGTSNSNMLRKRLSRKKVILVLDDVSELDQIKSIISYRVDFGYGSRIVVTSRDSHLLKNLGAKIYAVEKLDDCEALQLFCSNAFKEKIPQEGYLELAMRAVEYAQGLPLALEVLGSNLFQRSAEEWEDELHKLKGTSDRKIHAILKISYDGLSDLEKDIFLDIACCFKGRRKDEVESLLDVAGSKIGISRLAEKSLISIDSRNRLCMHALMQQMAKDTIYKEKTLEKRRWLWDPEDIYFLFTKELGTEAVRGITLDMTKTKNMNLSPTAFLKLYNLRYLRFYTSKHHSAQLCLPKGLEYLPEQLRYLYWAQYPSKSLPSISFCLKKLIGLNMCDSHLEELWRGVQDLSNLKWIDLSRSTKLVKVPDFSTATNLTSLNLNGCESLVEIPSLKYLSKLTLLELRECSKLESLPDDICDLKSLLLLDIFYCKNLHRLPQNFGNLKSLEKLDATKSGIKELPDSICNLKACTELYVNDCKSLHGLPQNVGNLQSLKYLCGGGSGMKELPSSINNLRELRMLTYAGCKGLIFPPLRGDFPYMSVVDLSDCGLSEFPVGHCSVTSLVNLNLCGNNFESIPESIKHLLKLRDLSLSNCKKLKYLPEGIKLLPELESIFLRECTSLGQNSNIIDQLTEAFLEDRRLRNRKWFIFPGIGVPERMKYKNERGSSLSFSFQLLQHVNRDELLFYACVVLDKARGNLLIKGNLMDEFGLNFNAEERLSCSRSFGGGDNLKHVVLGQIRFRSKHFVKGSKFTAKIQFQAYVENPKSRSFKNYWLYSSDGISKCGILPIFYHETIK